MESLKKCDVCGGSGYYPVNKITEESREIYGNDMPVTYAMKCPKCNGGIVQRVNEIRSKSKIPSVYYDKDISSFDWNYYLDLEGKPLDVRIHRAYAMNFLNNYERWQERGKGLYIYSRTKGSGKTFLASCLCNSVIQRYAIITKFVSVSSLIELAQLSKKEGEPNHIKILKECKLLVLDDLGQKTTGERWLEDILFEIIDYRSNEKLPIIVTSNIPLKDLAMDSRIVERINNMSYPLHLPEYCARQKAAYEERMEFFKEIGLWEECKVIRQ